jgi:hypothetical protein
LIRKYAIDKPTKASSKKERLFYREEYSFHTVRGRCLPFPKKSTREGVFCREEYPPKTGKHASV